MRQNALCIFRFGVGMKLFRLVFPFALAKVPFSSTHTHTFLQWQRDEAIVRVFVKYRRDRDGMNENIVESKSWKIYTQCKICSAAQTIHAHSHIKNLFYLRKMVYAWVCHTCTLTRKTTHIHIWKVRYKRARFAFSLIFLCGFYFLTVAAERRIPPYNYTNGDRLRQHLPIFKHLSNVLFLWLLLLFLWLFRTYTVCVCVVDVDFYDFQFNSFELAVAMYSTL